MVLMWVGGHDRVEPQDVLGGGDHGATFIFYILAFSERGKKVCRDHIYNRVSNMVLMWGGGGTAE